MSLDSAFTPYGSVGTVLVGVSAVQVLAATGGGAGSSGQSFRVRCLVTAYLTWGTGSGVTAVGAPSAGTPSANTIGMSAGQVEVFSFPPLAYFISTVAASFEITCGEGV